MIAWVCMPWHSMGKGGTGTVALDAKFLGKQTAGLPPWRCHHLHHGPPTPRPPWLRATCFLHSDGTHLLSLLSTWCSHHVDHFEVLLLLPLVLYLKLDQDSESIKWKMPSEKSITFCEHFKWRNVHFLPPQRQVVIPPQLLQPTMVMLAVCQSTKVISLSLGPSHMEKGEFA